MAMSVANNLKKRALALIAAGSEEMELVVAVDVLRRCDIDVTVALVQDGNAATSASNEDLVARCSRNVNVQADVTLTKYLQEHISDEASLPDAIILPGGLEGSRLMSKAPAVGELLRHYQSSAKIVAAICAAPTVFAAQGNLFAGRRLTSYPAFKDTLNGAGYAWQEPEQSANGRVVRDGNLITSMGPATSFDFALTVGAALTSQEAAEKVASAMLYKWPH
ncbi:protein dj-1beta-like [Anopheles albimanus]|uniref:DJ-1/PfpI domain-containing protein n=1 Tax=Anopheles albimanus TaxID=7167 RepID=A0A1I8JSR8_ANOAL|nr:protein dj-1beta-like [Anopheles albimanus]XP_035786681.1 protein dj-1beta-like [Anopheles albimanus]